MPFNLATFVRESNKIDPQPESYLSRNIIPGDQPGDLLYDNQVAALELSEHLFSQPVYKSGFAQDIHRELTRGIAFYEHCGMSGFYRDCQVYIGGEKPPAPGEVYAHMMYWINKVEKHRFHVKNGDMEPYAAAWWAHDCFECIHPFIDGNGRTGRLILNGLLAAFGVEQIVIYYEDRLEYYKNIRHFRATQWVNFIRKMGNSQ